MGRGVEGLKESRRFKTRGHEVDGSAVVEVDKERWREDGLLDASTVCGRFVASAR